jgi:uncharacterized phage protein (TIGR01671 family)
MNREIKFRVWDIELHMWINNIAMGKNNTLTKGTEKRFHVMQFTGLYDKEGKEIYEGDILCNYEYRTWEWRGVVKFSKGVFGAEWLSNIKNQSMVGSWGQKHNLRKIDDDILERQVVIGNIYETPHFLTEPS